VHYRVTRKSNRRIAPGELFLIDSGGQYEDGTTEHHPHHRGRAAEPRYAAKIHPRAQGAISRWPVRCFPTALPARSSTPWHGNICGKPASISITAPAHGVGSYLSVHEGPGESQNSAAWRSSAHDLSNEPGYYRTGAYGIRIENMILVTEAALVIGAEKPLNAFETLTLAPIDTRLVDPALLRRRRDCLVQRLSCARARHACIVARTPPRAPGDHRDGTACARLTASASADELRPLVLGQDIDAELLRLCELGAAPGPATT